jgi:hypothetical protein
MHSMRRLPLVLVTSVLVAACGGTTQPPDAEETAVDPSPSSSPSSPSSSAPADAVRAAEDLAATLDVAVEDVEVVATEEVTWRDGSRGCVRSGEMYTQALVEGLRITLRAGDRTYEYHSGGSQPPVLCEKPTE